MHIGRSRLVAVASAAALATLSFAGPALAHDGDRRGGGHGGGGHGGGGREIVVEHAAGPVIQQAVDQADPGDTVRIRPGEYDGPVVITDDRITLRGHGVVITPPTEVARDAAPPCDQPPPDPATGDLPENVPVSGICIFGPEDDPVESVSVRGITVREAGAHGLIAINTRDLSVEDSDFHGNAGYGAASFATEGTTFRDNRASGNGDAGFYVGDSPESRADIRGNHSTGNVIGYFIRNASHGKARDNVADGNCLGFFLLAEGEEPAGEPSDGSTGGMADSPAYGPDQSASAASDGDWHIRGNHVSGEDAACVAEFPFSGTGILVFGMTDLEIRHNTVTGYQGGTVTLPPVDENSPGEQVADPTAGGIVVLGIVPPHLDDPENPTPPTAPSGKVEDNRVTDNSPFDLRYDGEGDVDFDDNRCRTADAPEGLDLCNGRS